MPANDIENLKIKAPQQSAKPARRGEATTPLNQPVSEDREAKPVLIPAPKPEIPQTLAPGRPTTIRVLQPLQLVVAGMRQKYAPKDELKVSDYGPAQFERLLEQLNEHPTTAYEVVATNAHVPF